MGEQVLAPYATANDLFSILKARMPWYAPGSLTDEEYWQLTAYLAVSSDLLDNSTLITADNAASLRLLPRQSRLQVPAPAA